jgi:hypothetical protein
MVQLKGVVVEIFAVVELRYAPSTCKVSDPESEAIAKIGKE